MSYADVYRSWDRCWKDFDGYNPIGKLTIGLAERLITELLIELDLPEDASILDLGCGVGRTLQKFRVLGYYNAIGIDNSIESIRHCCARGLSLDEDIFLMDGTQTTFSDGKFLLVFSEGVLEHFKDFSPFVREIVRLSKTYILLLQPNHFSVYGAVLNVVSHLFRSNIKEYSYHPRDFIDAFEREGCALKMQRFTPLREVVAQLFEVFP